MSAPLPVNLSVAAAPIGWKGKLAEFFVLFEESLSAMLDPNVLIGQSGGAQPTHDIGPWFKDVQGQQGWWFFDPISGQYQPAQQGCPVGTIALWAGKANLSTLPPTWLICDGSEVSRSSFSTLFNAIGETWGPGDGSTSFNLPPGAVFFVNAANFVADYRVPLATTPQVVTDPTTGNVSPTGPSQGVGAQGGLQISGLLQPSDMPPMTVYIGNKASPFANGSAATPGTGFPNILQSSQVGVSAQDEFLSDMSGKQLGQGQTGFPLMPPFAAIYHMIKFQ